MRIVFGVLGLLIVLAVVSQLAKKQMGAVSITAPDIAVPASGATPQQFQKQIGQSVENSLQQARPMPEDK